MNKKIFLIFLFAYLLVIPTALAVKIDYSPNDKGVNDMKAHIQDTILFGLIKVREQGTMELKSHKSPTEIVKKNSGWDVNMYYEFNFGELHQEHLGEVEFINLKNNKSINREYRFVYLNGEIKERDVCVEYEDEEDFINRLKEEGKLNNKTNEEIKDILMFEEKECISYEKENYADGEWLPYNSKDIPKGKTIIGLEVNNKLGDKIDGIWNIGGKKIDKHAVWDVVETLTNSSNDVYSVNFNHDGSLLATGNSNGYVYIYDTSTWTLSETLTGLGTIVRSVNFNHDGSLLASGSADDNVYIYDTSTWTLSETLTNADGIIYSVDFNNDGSLLGVSAGADDNVYIYDTSTWTLSETLTEPTSTLHGLNFNHDGSLLAVGDINSNVYIYNTSTWTLSETLTEPTDRAYSVDFNHDGSYLAVGSFDNNVYIYDTSTWTLSENLTDATHWVFSVNFNHDGSYLAVGSFDNNVYIYDTSTWTLSETLTDAIGDIYSVDFNNDGSLLASGSADDNVYIYDTGKLKISLLTPSNNLLTNNQTIDFSANITNANDLENVTINIYYENGTTAYSDTNTSGTEGVYNWTTTLNDGVYNWNVLAIDTDTNEYYIDDNWTFTIDTELPIVEAELNETIIYAEGDVVEMTYKITDDNIDTCWYFYNGTTTEITCGTGLTEDITTTLSDLTIEVFGNDSSENQNNFTLEMTLDDTLPSINITSPTGTYDYLYNNYSIDLNFSINDTNLDSCWYEYNGTNNTLNCSENTTFNYIPNINNLTVYANDTLGNLGSELVELDYIVIEIDRTFNNETIETKEETFSIDLTSDEILDVKFIYDENEYSTSHTSLGGTSSRYSSTFDIPLVSSDDNITIYWNINDTVEINSTESTILVKNLNYDFDESYSLLNITVYDESTGELVNNTNFEMLSDYYIGSGNIQETIFSTSTENGTFDIGTNLLTSLLSSNRFTYSADGYQNRQWNGNLGLVGGSITDLELHLLSFTEGNIQFFHVADELTFSDVSDAFIKAERTEGTDFIFADSVYTDDSGSGNLWLNPDVAHKITITKEGCTTKTTTIYPTGASIQEIELDCGSTIEGPEYNSTEYLLKDGITVSFSPTTREITYDSNESSEHMQEFSVDYEDDSCNMTGAEFRLINTSDNSLLQSISSTECENTLSLNQNLTEADQIKAVLIIERDGNELEWRIIYDIIDVSGIAYEGSSLWNVINRLTEIDDFGLDQKTKTFLAFIILFLILGYLSMTGIIKSEGYALYLFILGYMFFFSYIGWFYLDLPVTMGSAAVQETINKWTLFLASSLAIIGILISKAND